MTGRVELTGSGLKARTPEGEPIALSLMQGVGEGALTLTIGLRTVEVLLSLADLQHLHDVAKDKHARAMQLGLVGAEPCVPRRELPAVVSPWT